MKCGILISLYNAENTLNRTFESLKTQTFQDFRIIAIDDHSKDHTLTLIKKWKDFFGPERFLLIENLENIGLTRSLNKGLDKLTEIYTARIDADDTWSETKLEKQIEFLESNPDYGVVGTFYTNISSKKARSISLPVTDIAIKKAIFQRNPFAHSCIVFRTHLVKEVGKYDESIRYGQDYDLWFRLFTKTRFANIPEFLCFRNIENTLTSSGNNQRAQMFQCIRTQIRYLGLYHRPLVEYCAIIEPLLVALAPHWLRAFKQKYL